MAAGCWWLQVSPAQDIMLQLTQSWALSWVARGPSHTLCLLIHGNLLAFGHFASLSHSVEISYIKSQLKIKMEQFEKLLKKDKEAEIKAKQSDCKPISFFINQALNLRIGVKNYCILLQFLNVLLILLKNYLKCYLNWKSKLFTVSKRNTSRILQKQVDHKAQTMTPDGNQNSKKKEFH